MLTVDIIIIGSKSFTLLSMPFEASIFIFKKNPTAWEDTMPTTMRWWTGGPAVMSNIYVVE